MKIKHFFSFIFLFFFVFTSWSLSIDSLKTNLKKQHLTKSEQAQINYNIAYEYFKKNIYDSALIYSDRATDEFNKLNSDKDFAKSLTLLSNILKKRGFNKRLFPVHYQLIQVLIKINDSLGLMSAYDRLGLYYYHDGIIDSSIYYYNKAYEIGKIKNNSKALMDSYNNISQVYNYRGDYKKELESLHKGLEMAITSDDDFSKGTFYHNISLSYINMGQYDSALYYITKAIDINSFIRETDRLALNKTALGNIYAMQGDVSKAMVYFNEALVYYTKSGNLQGQVESNYNLGFSYFYLEDYPPAQKYFFEALRIAKMINLTSYQVDLYESLSEVYEAQGDDKKALVYYKQHKMLQDSIIQTTNMGLISKIQSEYEYERNTIEIKLLSKENELKDKRVQNTLVIAIISTLSLIVMLVLTIFIFRKLRKNEELNNQLRTQNIDIQDSHKKLLNIEQEVERYLYYAGELQTYFYNDKTVLDAYFNDLVFKSYTKKSIDNSFLWSKKAGNKLYWSLITIRHDLFTEAITGMYFFSKLNEIFHTSRTTNAETFTKRFITESFSPDISFGWGNVQMLFCIMDIQKSELQMVNIGIDVELIRNAKVWEFKAVCPFVDMEKIDTILSNKIQLQDEDELIFFSKNWTKKDISPFSAGKRIYNKTVSSNNPDYQSFLQELSDSEEIDDFIFMSLKK